MTPRFSVPLQRVEEGAQADWILECFSRSVSCVHDEFADGQFQVLVPEARNRDDAQHKVVEIMNFAATNWDDYFRVLRQG